IQGDAVVRAADGGTWALDLSVRRGEVADHRVLVADHCPALADAVALVIAVFVDPVAVGDAFTMIEPDPQRVPLPEPPRAPASTSTRAAPQALVRPQEPSVARPKTRSSTVRWSTRFAGGLELGGLPGPSGCVGLEAGAVQATGRGLAIDQAQRRPWVTAVVAPALRWSLTHGFGLWFGVELAVPLVAPRLVVEQGADAIDILAHQPAPITGRVLVGIEVLFPKNDRGRPRS
ncbi:MAG: hypothetical protein KC636_39970, partial [Myxococcales bacterium]|nr:hypothetical protein [Myxococcales bacterium]